MEKYKIEKNSVPEILNTVLGCVRQPLAKLADGPMHLQIVRIDFAEYSHG